MARTKLADMDLLQGQTEEISLMELRAGPGDVMDQVLMGKTYIIMRLGKAIAVLQPLPGESLVQVVASNGDISYRCRT